MPMVSGFAKLLGYHYYVDTMVCMDVGFEKPSAIQQRAIIPMVKARDVIAQ